MSTATASDLIARSDRVSALSLRASLIIASVLWLDVLMVSTISSYLTPDSEGKFADADLVALSCTLMFAPLWLLSVRSWHVGYELHRWRALLFGHILLALLFGVCARPALLMAKALLSDGPGLAELLRMEFAGPARSANVWGLYIIEATVQYLVIQGILVGAAYYLRHRFEHSLRERLASECDRARLHALRMQTNPHFLFNTLNAISGLIRTSPRAAEAMVARLGFLFRATLADRDCELITLRRELELGAEYLEIQRIRFDGRFDYRIRCDPRVGETWLPPLVLQPLLENAAEHGLSGSDGQINVDIHCEPLMDAGVRITVTNHAGSQGQREPARGFGLEIVRERLQAAFGAAANLVAEHRRDGLFEARLEYRR